MKKKIRVIVKHPFEPGHEETIENSLSALQKIVGGYVEAVNIDSDTVLLCNEEGRLIHLPYNCTAWGYSFYGPIIIIGQRGDSFTDTEMTLDEWSAIIGSQS